MATETDRANETEVEKTVTLLGYIKPKYGASAREAANALDDDRDYYKKKRYKSEKRYLVVGEKEQRIRSDDFWMELQNRDLGDANLRVEEKVNETFEYRLDRFAKRVARDILEDLDVDLPVGLTLDSYWTRVENREDEKKLNFYNYMDDIPLVKHEEERDPMDENPYVDEDTEYPALKYKVKISGSTTERVEMMTEEVVEKFYREMASLEFVERVRLLDCEITTVEQGACYNI